MNLPDVSSDHARRLPGRSTRQSSGSSPNDTGLASRAAFVSTTRRADGTSAVAQRALENWWYSTYADFSDEYVKSATILELVRQSYLLMPEPGSPVMTFDMLGTRGLNIFLRKKQFEDANRCLEQKTGYVASTIVMNQTSNINAEIKCSMVHNQTPYTVKNGSSLIFLALILTNLPLPHPHTPDHSSLPSLRLFRSCTFMVALRHSKLHQKKDYHKTLIDRRTLEKLMDFATELGKVKAELKALKDRQLMPSPPPSPSPTSLPPGQCTLCGHHRSPSPLSTQSSISPSLLSANSSNIPSPFNPNSFVPSPLSANSPLTLPSPLNLLSSLSSASMPTPVSPGFRSPVWGPSAKPTKLVGCRAAEMPARVMSSNYKLCAINPMVSHSACRHSSATSIPHQNLVSARTTPLKRWMKRLRRGGSCETS